VKVRRDSANLLASQKEALMAGAHEIAEKIEHAAHGGHEGGGVGRLAGITMAILGVMLALCSAMVGGQRTEIIATMVEQSNTYGKLQAQSMKQRMTMQELATLHALSPSQHQLKNFEELLDKMQKDAGRLSKGDELTVDAVGESTRALAAILQPKRSDMERTLDAAKRYAEHVEGAKKWAEAYEPAIEAHSEASEHYEWAQLCAEIGIVIASVALLLANRKAWMLSVVLGTACASLLVWTVVTTHAHLAHAEEGIHKAKEAYAAFRKDSSGKDDDAELLAAVEKKIASLPAPQGSGSSARPNAPSAAPGSGEHATERASLEHEAPTAPAEHH
jgi:hypothetical protein